MGREPQKEFTYTYVYMSDSFAVQQKLTQRFKLTISQQIFF